MTTAHLNIGSNLGSSPLDNITKAIDLLGIHAGQIVAVSAPFSSLPWGYESARTFVNVGVNLRTSLTPERLLQTTQAVERMVAPADRHRTPQGGYADRVIDIDIIAMDSLTSLTAHPLLPHPLMHLREFVLVPMLEVWPQWRHPLRGGSAVADLLAALHNKEAGVSV